MEYYRNESGVIYNGDCLEVMDRLIADGIKVDAIITDPPYGTTACKWDTIIPFNDMWERLNKLAKSNGAIVLFGSEPFSSALRMSNIKKYKYDWIWEKEQGANFMLMNYQPYKIHEIISVFSFETHKYYPQKTKGKPYISGKGKSGETSGNVNKVQVVNKGERYPKSILRYNTDKCKSVHPTEKPVDLMEYLIKTYTKEGELVLDFTCGSGSTLVACQNLGRKFIGIELEEKYCKIAEQRLSQIKWVI